MQDHKMAADFRDAILTSLDEEDKLREFGGNNDIRLQSLATVITIHAWNPQVAAVFFDNGKFLVAYKMGPGMPWQVAQTDTWTGASPADPFDMDSMDPGDHVQRVDPKFFVFVDRNGQPTKAGKLGLYSRWKPVSLPQHQTHPPPSPTKKPTSGQAAKKTRPERSASAATSKATSPEARLPEGTPKSERADAILGVSVTLALGLGLLVLMLACGGFFVFQGGASSVSTSDRSSNSSEEAVPTRLRKGAKQKSKPRSKTKGKRKKNGRR